MRSHFALAMHMVDVHAKGACRGLNMCIIILCIYMSMVIVRMIYSTLRWDHIWQLLCAMYMSMFMLQACIQTAACSSAGNHLTARTDMYQHLIMGPSIELKKGGGNVFSDVEIFWYRLYYFSLKTFFQPSSSFRICFLWPYQRQKSNLLTEKNPFQLIHTYIL